MLQFSSSAQEVLSLFFPFISSNVLFVVYITLQISYLRCDNHVESQAQVPILQGETIRLETRRLCLCFPLFTLFFPFNVQALHKPTIYIGLKFKRWSNLRSRVAASSTLPTLRACE